MDCPETERFITNAKLWLVPQMVQITFSDGVEWNMTFEEANKRVKVKGIPIIDFYAKLN
jgi:hypothetical protein